MQVVLEENPAFVLCPMCHQRHLVPEVTIFDIDEDVQGFDTLHYDCPITQQRAKATVYRCR